MNYKELTAMKSMITNRMNAVTTDIAWETQGVAPPMLNYISYKGTTKTIIDLVDEEVMRAILELMPDLERIVDRAYNDGYDHGCAVGERDGFYKGHTEGQEDGSQYSYGEGYDAGYNTGGKEGYDEGHSEGYDAGYNTGRKEGFDEGHDEGYWKGEREGYEKGYLARIESIQRPLWEHTGHLVRYFILSHVVIVAYKHKKNLCRCSLS